MVKQEVCAQATKYTYILEEHKGDGWDGQTSGLRSSDKFTYELEERKDETG